MTVAVMLTHLIAASARPVGRNQYRADCGELVDGRSHARNAAPTCPDCAALAEEDERETMRVAAMLSTPPEHPVKSTYGDPLAGYRPKGSRR